MIYAAEYSFICISSSQVLVLDILKECINLIMQTGFQK